MLLRFPRLTPPINNQHVLNLEEDSFRQKYQIMFKTSPLSSETQFWEEAVVVAPPLRYLSRSPGSMGFERKEPDLIPQRLENVQIHTSATGAS